MCFPLQAVERLTATQVPPSQCQALLEAFLKKWLRVVESESHEGTLLQGMSALQSWFGACSPVPTATVKQLTDSMQVGCFIDIKTIDIIDIKTIGS